MVSRLKIPVASWEYMTAIVIVQHFLCQGRDHKFCRVQFTTKKMLFGVSKIRAIAGHPAWNNSSRSAKLSVAETSGCYDVNGATTRIPL